MSVSAGQSQKTIHISFDHPSKQSNPFMRRYALTHKTDKVSLRPLIRISDLEFVDLTRINSLY